jgi:hypothetical protein
VRDRLGDLVESLLDVAGNHEDVADVAEIELLVDVDRAIDRIAVIERGDAPHRLRSEARARPEGGRGVEGHADEGCLVSADPAHVLAVGRFHEGVDAGEGGLMASAEAGDGPVGHRPRGFEAVAKRAPHLLLLLRLRNARQPLQIAIAAEFLIPLRHGPLRRIPANPGTGMC